MKMYCINHVFTEFLNSACENSATAVRLIKKESGPLKRINILECVIIYKSKPSFSIRFLETIFKIR